MGQDTRFWAEAERESRDKENAAEMVRLRERVSILEKAIHDFVTAPAGSDCAWSDEERKAVQRLRELDADHR